MEAVFTSRQQTDYKYKSLHYTGVKSEHFNYILKVSYILSFYQIYIIDRILGFNFLNSVIAKISHTGALYNE